MSYVHNYAFSFPSWSSTIYESTHWDLVMHTWVSHQAIIGLHNGLSLIPNQAITRTNGNLYIVQYPLKTIFNGILFEIPIFAKKNW